MMKDIKDFFKHWTNLERDDIDLKLTLFKYYLENGFNNYLAPASQLILLSRLPHREFEKITYSSTLASLDQKNSSFIILLINYIPFLDSLTNHRKKYIYNYLKDNISFWSLKEEDLKQTQLYQEIKSEIITEEQSRESDLNPH